MSDENKWQIPEDNKHIRRIFAAAREGGAQLVSDREGVFTVSYSKRAPKGSSQEFLIKGTSDVE